MTSTERGRLDQEPLNASAALPVHLKSHDNLIPRLPSSKYPPSRQRAAAAPLAPRYRTRQSSCPEIAATVGMRGRELPSAPSSSTRSMWELRFRA